MNYFTKVILNLAIVSMGNLALAGGIHCPPGEPSDGKCTPQPNSLTNTRVSALSAQLSQKKTFIKVTCLDENSNGVFNVILPSNDVAVNAKVTLEDNQELNGQFQLFNRGDDHTRLAGATVLSGKAYYAQSDFSKPNSIALFLVGYDHLSGSATVKYLGGSTIDFTVSCRISIN